jgi:hypothetical protein
MALAYPEDKKRWNEMHDQLRIALQKEIHLMREILANLHQEELSLLLNDKGSWAQLMEERSQMIYRLSNLRIARMNATEKLQIITSEKGEKKDFSLEHLLPIDDENSCEVLSLRDQLMALTEKMNFQNSLNQNLQNQIKNIPEYQKILSFQQGLKSQPIKAKRKSSIATYNPQDP